MSMNLGNLNKCMRIRLTEEQMKHVCDLSEIYNMSPSAYVRTLIDVNMIMCNKGDSLNEDEQTFLDCKL